MGSRTIDIQEDTYERLRVRKRDDESFTDLVERLLEDSVPDWRESFGTMAPDETEELEALVEQRRDRIGRGLVERQAEEAEAHRSGEGG